MKRLLFAFLILIPFVVNAEEVVSETTKYYKTVETIVDNPFSQGFSVTTEVTKEEYDASTKETIIRNNVIVETTYKRLSVTISQTGNYYKYEANLHWKQMPYRRSYDIIGIGHYSNVTPGLTPLFTQEYCYPNGSCTTTGVNTPMSFSNGFSAVFELPSGNISSLDQTLSAIMIKSNASSTITSQKAVADYAHATSNISLTNAKKHTMGLGGLILNSSITSYYDSISYAESTWTGSW